MLSPNGDVQFHVKLNPVITNMQTNLYTFSSLTKWLGSFELEKYDFVFNSSSYIYFVKVLKEHVYEIINFLLSGQMRHDSLSQERCQFLQAKLILIG